MGGSSDKLALNPTHKRWLLWGGAVAVLSMVVVVFGGSKATTGQAEEDPQQAIQGIISGGQTRDVSIGALSERLERQRQQKNELQKDLSDLNDKLTQLQERQKRIEQIEKRNKQLATQVDNLRSTLRAQKQQSAEDQKQSTETAAKPAPQPGPDARRPVNPSEAFRRAPTHPAPQDTDSSSPETRSTALKIRTIGDGGQADEAVPKPAGRTVHDYMQTGSIVTGVLLSGLDAPTNVGAQQNTLPVTLRVKKNAVLPNRHRSDIRECFVLMEGYGELSSERVYLRANTLSCVREDDTVLEVPMRAYAVGEDGKTGLRGRLVSKQGAVIARSMVSGFASGMAQAFEQTPVPTIQTGSSISGEQQFQRPNVQASAESGAFTGASSALNQVAEFYLNMAEQMFPVLEVNPGRRVDLVMTSGMDMRAGQSAEADQNQSEND